MGLRLDLPEWDTSGWYKFVESSASSRTGPSQESLSCAGFPQVVQLPAWISPSSRKFIAHNYDLQGATILVTDEENNACPILAFSLFSLVAGFQAFASVTAQPCAASAVHVDGPARSAHPVETSAACPESDVPSSPSASSESDLLPQAWVVSEDLKQKLQALKK